MEKQRDKAAKRANRKTNKPDAGPEVFTPEEAPAAPPPGVGNA